MNIFNQTDSESSTRNMPTRASEVKFWKSAWFITTVTMIFLVIAPLASADSQLIGDNTPSQEGEGEGATDGSQAEGEQEEAPEQETPPEGEDPLPETPGEQEEPAPEEETGEEGTTEGVETGEGASEESEAPPAEEGTTEGAETGEGATEGESEAPTEESTEGVETGEGTSESSEEAPAESSTDGVEAGEGEAEAPAEGATDDVETGEGEAATPAEGATDGVEAGEDDAAAPGEGATDGVEANVNAFVLADAPVAFAPVDNIVAIPSLGTTSWVNSTAEGADVVALTINSNHPTAGNSALRISMPVTSLTGEVENDPNNVSWTRTLDVSEDWTAYNMVTMDVYAEEQLADMPFLQLTLSNSSGNGTTVTMLPGRDLVQWENPGIIFPINSVGDEILSDVSAVTFTAAGYNDGLFGPAQDALNIHVDNIKLDGSVMWESFETSPYAIEAATVETTLAGITNNANYDGTPGGLVLSWSSAEEGNGIASIAASEAQDWSGITAVRGWVYASNGEVPIALSVTDGTNSITAEAVSTGVANEWAAVTWLLPTDDTIDLSSVRGMSLGVADLATYPEGTVWVDGVSAAVSINTPYDVSVMAGAGSNEISWNNPVSGDATSYTVVAAINDFASSAEEGIVVCDVAIDAPSVCIHEGIEADTAYYYTVLANGAEGVSFSDASKATPAAAPFVITPAGSSFEITINRDNGAIESINNALTGELISQGNAGGAVWMLKFFDEESMPMLSSAEFSADSEEALFSINEETGTLTYSYDMDGDSATAEVSVQVQLSQVDRDTFDWNMTVENNSGLTVRKVIMPHGMGFEAAGLDRVYVPVWEGMALEQTFFVDSRSTHFGRASMFADMVAIEHDAGNMAFYTIQDSLYQSDIIPGHNADEAVLQPADYHIWGNGNSGYVAMEIGAAIPSGQTWNSATVRFHIGADLDEVMEGYMADTGLDQTPSLAEKDVLFGQFDQMAESALLSLDISAIEAETGQTWVAIRDEVLATLPENAIVQFNRWQDGGVDAEGNPIAPAINQDLPNAPISTDQHGSLEDLQTLLDVMNANGILAAPYVDWTVWTQLAEETGNLPSLENSPDALRSSTATQPAILDGGYVLKSWSDDLRARNDALVAELSDGVTLDLLYSEMSGADRWRYSYLDDASQASASAYTQGLINETNRLGEGQPLIVGAMMDQMASGVTGFAGSLRQEQTTGLLRHLGPQYEAWNAYPLAAMMMHDKVAFYPNPAQNARPTASRAEFTYYTLMGYNLAEDASTLTGGRAFWMPMISSFQGTINSRTFGEEMISYEVLSEDGKQIETVFGSGRDKITISANFDLDGAGTTAQFDGYTVSPDGFHARSADGSMVGGVYLSQFNGNELSSGRHWITVEQIDNTIEVRQTFGVDTDIMVNRPRSWRNAGLIQMVQLMDNGRAIPVEVADILPDRILINYTNTIEGLATDRFILYYNELDNGFDIVASIEDLTAEILPEETLTEGESTESESAADESTEEAVTDEAEAAGDEAVETPTEGEGENAAATEGTGDEGVTDGGSDGEAATESEATPVEGATEEGSGEETAEGEAPAENEGAAEGGESEEVTEEGTTEEAGTTEGETPGGDETVEGESETPPETADEPVEGDAPPEGDTPPADDEGATDGGEGSTDGGEGSTDGEEDPAEGSETETPEGDGN